MSNLPQIGLDIGSASIKIVELVPKGDKWRLMTAASSATASEVNEKANLTSMAQTLARMVREAGVRSRRVVVSLPEEKVFTHAVDMPLLPDNEVGQALQWQVEQYIPMPLDQAVWSFEIIKKDEAAGKMEVLLVAAGKTLVDAYRQVVETAGLEPVAFETELMATARAILLADSPLSAVVDIGSKSTDVGLARARQLLFARTVPTAGEAFTRAIETTLGLDTSQAENYKNTYGFSAKQLEGKLLEAMKPVMTVIATEVKKTVDFYVAKHPGETVKTVIISGGVAALPDVVSALSANLGLEVVVGNPLAQMELDQAQANALKGHEPFYSVAIGLAERND